jgi:hypothetical protein
MQILSNRVSNLVTKNGHFSVMGIAQNIISLRSNKLLPNVDCWGKGVRAARLFRTFEDIALTRNPAKMTRNFRPNFKHENGN